MKILFVSNLFPDAANPNRGIYNARLVKHLAALCEMRVVSPRPTRGFPPFWSPRTFNACAEDSAFSPAFPPSAYLPKIGSRWNHQLMARSLRETVRELRAKFPFDIVLASWIYPDGCAMAELAAEMDFPFAVIAQGSDVHQYLKIPARRRIIVSSLARARAVITRSQALAGLLRDAGVAEEKLHTIYNGVETGVFRPGDKSQARLLLGLAQDETVLLFVGNFLPIKNPLLLLDSLAELTRLQPGKKLRLVMLGDGPLLPELQRRAKQRGLLDCLSLPGRKSPAEVARFMQAADLLCVPSDNEGVPNVVLEAFACGLRVVATKVGGLPEIVTEDFLGRLVEPHQPADFAKAVAESLAVPPQTERIIGHAERFTWPQTALAYLAFLRQALS